MNPDELNLHAVLDAGLSDLDKLMWLGEGGVALHVSPAHSHCSLQSPAFPWLKHQTKTSKDH